MKKKYINNHFIQKGLAKNFAANKIIKWKRYQTNEGGEFNIDKTPNAKQPISKQNFYSEKIEKEMNALESAGIRVFRCIAFQAQSNTTVKIYPHQWITLRFYSLLTFKRTQRMRENILNKPGNSLFNNTIIKDGRNSQEIHEEMMAIILKYWKSNKKKLIWDFEKRFITIVKWEKFAKENKPPIENFEYFFKHFTKYNTVESSTLSDLITFMLSRMLILKFEKPKLLFPETFGFFEWSEEKKRPILLFIPICANIGVVFYFHQENAKSRIFKNDVSKPRHEYKYSNIRQIKDKENTFLKMHKFSMKQDLEKLKELFRIKEAPKYFSKEDHAIYQILEELEGTADFCNAMSLKNIKNSILIYQNEKDIKDAERKILENRITKIQD